MCVSASNAKLEPTLFDVWVLHVQSHLDSPARLHLTAVAAVFSCGILCDPLWLTRLWQPHPRCHRRCGFGTVSSNRSAAADNPAILHVFHQLWPFLSPCGRHQSQLLSPSTLRCSYQCIHAAVTSVASLCTPQPSPTKLKSIDRPCTCCNADRCADGRVCMPDATAASRC